MKSLIRHDTITAIATPPGESALGIVRLCGPNSTAILRKIFITKKGKLPAKIESHRAVHGFIIDPDKNQRVDEVMLTIMKAPKTYTGEDTAEITAHGSTVSLDKILSLTISRGARPANPGEFTLRAFLNGRMDLVQAESVLEIIKAKTEGGLMAAMKGLEGDLSKKIREIREGLADILAALEASFIEDDIVVLPKKEVVKRLEEKKKEIKEILERFETGKLLRGGPSVVITGRPNAGKSSLFNLLLEKDRAIVSTVAGTTRDSIEDSACISGINLRILDTAGMRRGGSGAEREGAKRAVGLLKDASLVLFVVDTSRPLSREDRMIVEKIKGQDVLIALNKKDLKKRFDEKKLKTELQKEKLVETSAKTGEGIEKIKKEMGNILSKKYGLADGGQPLLLERHRDILNKTEKSLLQGIAALKNGMEEEFAAMDIKKAIEYLEEATGEKPTEDLLERIFNNFCVGK